MALLRAAVDSADITTMADILSQARATAPPDSRATLKRLLLVSNSFPASLDDYRGAWILDFIEALHKQGVESAVFSTVSEPPDDSINIPTFSFACGKSSSRLNVSRETRLTAYFRVKDCLRKGSEALVAHLQANQYDHLLALGGFPAGAIVSGATEQLSLPFSVWTLGDDIHFWAKRLLFGGMVRRALRRATFLFANGDKLCEEVAAICGRECRYLPTLRRFHYKMLPMPREKFFIYVGALETHRGIFDLLKAFARIKKDIWDYRLLVVGSGAKADKVERSINALKLRGKVHLLGNLPNDELINYLQRAHAVVTPSHDDSIPLVFGEAMQTATPMIVTDSGDLGTLVHDNKLGFVARRKSPSSLADAMVRSIVSDLDIRTNAKHLVQRLAPENAAQILLETLTPDC